MASDDGAPSALQFLGWGFAIGLAIGLYLVWKYYWS
jgi:hypothetical protein